MVGIAGYASRGIRAPEGTLDAMAEQLKHFPHHLKEAYNDDLVQVARVHLGIFNRERQPVFSDDGSIGVLGEGMVYGLPGEGDPRNESMASEPQRNWLKGVARSFQLGGARTLAALNGSFSLVIFDSRGGKIHLVSDRFATRPMYYWHRENELAFATESKAILKYPSYQKKLNLVAVSKFFRYGRLCVFGDDTWFEGIRGLPPASMLTLNGGDCTISKYWDLVYDADKEATPEVFSERLVGSFRDSVRMRTSERDLRYSVALSGGLDSRSVLAAFERKDNVTAYTFGAFDTQEIAIANKVARTAGTKHFVCYIDPESTAKYAEDVVWLSDGLEVVGITFLLNAGIRLEGNFDVSLDGFALDLTLGGSFLKRNIMAAESLPELAAILDKKFAVFTDAEMKSLFSADFLALMGDEARKSFLETVSSSKGDTLPDRADYFALSTRVRNYTIMGHVLSRNFYEDTIPTLDNKFMEVVASIPPSLRYRYSIYRRFLKKLDPSLARIQYERTGMSPNRPFTMWMVGIVLERAFKIWNDSTYKVTRGRIGRFHTNAYLDLSGALRLSRAWKDLISRTVVSKDSLIFSSGIIQRERVLRLVEEHMTGRRDNREKILYLITFELILRGFFPESGRSISA